MEVFKMVYAQVVFSALLVLFASLTWLVYRKLADIEGETQRMWYDPKLMLPGWWSQTVGVEGEHLVNKWTGGLVLCNPGPTPIVLMMWNYVKAAPGTQHTVKQADTQEILDLTRKPLVLPGYSHERIKVEVTGRACRAFEVSYATSRGGMKTASVEMPPTLAEVAPNN